MKAFLSTCDDKYRPSYGRVVESHPRQCIIIATVNGERGYLRDITGNRRFWIIKVHQKKQKKTWNFTDEYRQQFWAEAKAIWKSGEKLFLEGDVLAESERVQQSAMEVDERVGMVEEYLNALLPTDWDSMDLYQRRNFLQGSEFGQPIIKARGSYRGQQSGNLVRVLWQESAGIEAFGQLCHCSVDESNQCWERTNSIKRQPIYGRQRLYKFGG